MLLIRNTEGADIPGFSFPGGRQEARETSLEAGVRELNEETGLQAKPEDLILWKHGFEPYVSPISGISYPLLMYICTRFEGEISSPLDPTETVADAQWANIFHLPPPLAPRAREFILAGRKHLHALRRGTVIA